MAKLWWGFWRDYPKVWINGREYAHIGERFYTEHVITRSLPSGRRTIAGPVADREGGGYAFDPKARSISPDTIEFTICHGAKEFVVENKEARTIHTAGDLVVITTRDERIVISAIYNH